MKGNILKVLKTNKNEWVSGEEICRHFSISRTAVWKHIKALKQEGYEIETQPRRGYRLINTPDVLYPLEVGNNLNTNIFGSKIIHHHQLTSTNEEAKKMAAQGVQEGTVVVAEQQVGGKGRLGRKWFSQAGKDILFSVILYPNLSPGEIPQICMLSAVAVARAIENTCSLRSGIKWPNDLLIDGKKICGILVEIGAEADRVRYVVLGIGINVNSSFSDWPKEIREKTTSLKEAGGLPVARVKLFQEVLRQLERLYIKWQQDGFEPILKQWRTWCISQHCHAKVETIRGSYHGWIEGVSNSGALVLRMDDGSLRTFLSGDVSLRL